MLLAGVPIKGWSELTARIGEFDGAAKSEGMTCYAIAPGWHPQAACEPRRSVDGRATLSGTVMGDLLLPLTAIFCACSTVAWALALLDLLK